MDEIKENTVETPAEEKKPVSPMPDYSKIWGGGEPIAPDEEPEQVLAEFVEMTDEEVMNAICELDAGGRKSESEATVTLARILGYASKIDDNGELLEGIELTDDDMVPARETDLSGYRLTLGTIDGVHCSADFTFSSADDYFLEEFADILAQYTEEMSAFMSGESPDLPRLIINIMPYKGGGRYMVNFVSPIAMNKTVDEEGIPNTLSLVYHMEDIAVDTIEYTQQEYNQLKDDAYNRERRRMEFEDSEASHRELFS